MKIGVLSDIHGNSYALREVLKIARQENIKKLIVLGDIVGYYYFPDKVLEQLADWDYSLIKGNHEVILENIMAGTITESEIRLKYGSGHKKAIENLSTNQLEILSKSPPSLKLDLDNVRFLMCHGSPWDSDYYLYPYTPREVLDKCNQIGTDFILIGHSHHSFIYKGNDTILINVGSVGQNRNMGGLASWAIIDTLNWGIQLRLTPYDVSQLILDVEAVDPLNSYLKNILVRNRK